MNSYDFGNKYVEELRLRSERLNMLLSTCEQMEGYKNIRFCELSGTDRNRGYIKYRKNYSEITFNTQKGCAELTIAHEVMHNVLVLEGALLPMVRDSATDRGEKLYSQLIVGYTHHPLLSQRLIECGYIEEMRAETKGYYDLLHQAVENANDIDVYDFINLLNYRPFIFEEDKDNLYDILANTEEKKVVLDMSRSAPNSIEGINALSRQLIRYFDVEAYIVLGDLNTFVHRSDEFV